MSKNLGECSENEILDIASFSLTQFNEFMTRDVNDNTSSSIIKLRYRIVSISKRNDNV